MQGLPSLISNLPPGLTATLLMIITVRNNALPKLKDACKTEGKIIHNRPQIFSSIFQIILQHLCRLHLFLGCVLAHSTEVGLCFGQNARTLATHYLEQGLHFCLQGLARLLVLLRRKSVLPEMLLLCLGPRLDRDACGGLGQTHSLQPHCCSHPADRSESVTVGH